MTKTTNHCFVQGCEDWVATLFKIGSTEVGICDSHRDIVMKTRYEFEQAYYELEEDTISKIRNLFTFIDCEANKKEPPHAPGNEQN